MIGIVSAMIIGLDLGTTSISAVLFDPERCAALCSTECANNAGIAGLAKGCHETPSWPVRRERCRLAVLRVWQSSATQHAAIRCWLKRWKSNLRCRAVSSPPAEKPLLASLVWPLNSTQDNAHAYRSC